MAVVYASYSLRAGEAITESVVRESMEHAVDERVDWDGESMAMAMSDVFSPFHIFRLYRTSDLFSKVILVRTTLAGLLYL